jgi:hypothetical protein
VSGLRIQKILVDISRVCIMFKVKVEVKVEEVEVKEGGQ